MGALTQNAIKVKKNNTAAIPMQEILADRYSASVPASAHTFLDILKDLEEFTAEQFEVKAKSLGITIKMPTQNAFNNCRGGWSEFIFAAYSWNELAKVNQINAETGGPIYIFVKLPDNKDSATKWTAVLDKKHDKVIKAFDRDAKNDEEVSASRHEHFLLNSSNPDVAIFKFSVAEYARLSSSLPLDPTKPISDLSLDTQAGFSAIFPCLARKIAPRKNLHCFLSVKDSLKPDRRLQFLHEGNNVKAILLYLINERNSCDALLKYDILHNVYYAVSFSKITARDKESLDAAMVACLTSPSLPKTWAVDDVFECISQPEVEALFTTIIP